jgi:hypothetical protein
MSTVPPCIATLPPRCLDAASRHHFLIVPMFTESPTFALCHPLSRPPPPTSVEASRTWAPPTVAAASATGDPTNRATAPPSHLICCRKPEANPSTPLRRSIPSPGATPFSFLPPAHNIPLASKHRHLRCTARHHRSGHVDHFIIAPCVHDARLLLTPTPWPGALGRQPHSAHRCHGHTTHFRTGRWKMRPLAYFELNSIFISEMVKTAAVVQNLSKVQEINFVKFLLQ